MKYLILILLSVGTIANGLELDEATAVKMLLANNTDIINAALEVQIAVTEKDAGGAMYRPRLRFDSSRVSSDDADINYAEAAIEQLFTSGTLLSIAAGRTDTDFSSILIPDTDNRAASITIRQSLLQNSFGRASRAIYAVADQGIVMAEYGKTVLQEELIMAAVSMYWEYVLAEEKLLAETERFDYYQKLYAHVEEKKQVGMSEERDLLITRGAFLQSAMQIKQAEAVRDRLERALRLMISPENIIELEPAPVDPTVDIDLRGLINPAELGAMLASRPDVRLLETSLRMNALQSIYSTSSSFPALDLVLGYSTDSFYSSQGAGYLSPSDQEPGYMVGISFAYTFGGDTNAADADKAFLQNIQLRNDLVHKRAEVLNDYRNAVQAYTTALEVFELATASVDVNKAKVDNEYIELKRGRSDYETLVQFEDQYIAARIGYIQSLGQLRIAIAGLRRSTGSLQSAYTAEDDSYYE